MLAGTAYLCRCGTCVAQRYASLLALALLSLSCSTVIESRMNIHLKLNHLLTVYYMHRREEEFMKYVLIRALHSAAIRMGFSFRSGIDYIAE